MKDKTLGEIWFVNDGFNLSAVTTLDNLVAIVANKGDDTSNVRKIAAAQEMYEALTAPGMEKGKALAAFWKLRHKALQKIAEAKP